MRSRDRLNMVSRLQGERIVENHTRSLHQAVSKNTYVKFYYYMRTKSRLNEGRKRSSKLSYSYFLSYFFHSCLFVFLDWRLEPVLM